MAGILVTPLVVQVGEYGRAEAHRPIRVRRALADQLVATGRWVEGESDAAKEAKRRDAELRRLAKSKKAERAAG
jgi:hypothetical protein